MALAALVASGRARVAPGALKIRVATRGTEAAQGNGCGGDTVVVQAWSRGQAKHFRFPPPWLVSSRRFLGLYSRHYLGAPPSIVYAMEGAASEDRVCGRLR